METTAHKIASLLSAIQNCQQSGNAEWEQRHKDALDDLIKNHMPSGSGFDSGTKLSDKSTPEKLIFQTSYHHMNNVGMYDGWTEHTVTVSASLVHGIDLKISGWNRNDIKDYIADTFAEALKARFVMG